MNSTHSTSSGFFCRIRNAKETDPDNLSKSSSSFAVIKKNSGVPIKVRVGQVVKVRVCVCGGGGGLPLRHFEKKNLLAMKLQLTRYVRIKRKKWL